MKHRSVAIAFGGLAALLPIGVGATPLEPAACDQLRQELSALDKAGVRIHFTKGAHWGMANLTPEQLGQVERLLETEQQFLFRCPQPKRQLDPAVEAIMEHGTGSDPDPDAPKPEAPAARPVAPKRPAKTKAAATVDPPAQVPAPAVAAAKPKRAAPKAVDAYVPEPAAKAAGAPTALPAPQ
jgi:hypothetical protein